ncbi:hypothetical protein E4U53_006538 [Claviceps sorghi]|nr:hypothetical protein E4U53_006538 [Claviceps sorghi]
MQSATDGPLYALQDIPGKGKGLVATRDIPKGTRILCEKALITLPGHFMHPGLLPSLCQQVEALSNDERHAFLSMHNIRPFKNAAEQYMGIFVLNCLPAEEVGEKRAIFLEACRINHACDKNSLNMWNDRIKRHTVHALRKIHAGEEITISYITPFMNRQSRQRDLQEKFRFTCSCGLCSLPEKQSQESDKRLEQIQHLVQSIEQSAPVTFWLAPRHLLSCLDARVRLHEEQGRQNEYFTTIFREAAHLTIAHGDLARGRIFAQRAAAAWTTAMGGDSGPAIECAALARNPSKCILYGISTMWKTTVGEESQGLGPDDFEDWLWRRNERR